MKTEKIRWGRSLRRLGIIFQTNNGCSLLSLILAELLLLDIRCENMFALYIVTALTAYPFSIKQCAKMSIFNVKTVKFFVDGLALVSSG